MIKNYYADCAGLTEDAQEFFNALSFMAFAHS